MRQFQLTPLVAGHAGPMLSLEVNVTSIKRVRALLDVDLASPEDGEPEPLVTRLSIDPILVCDVLYALCKPQCDGLNLTDEQFGQSMGGESLAAGQQALFEELADFFQKLGRTEKASMVRAQANATRLAVARGTQRIDSLPLETMIDSAFGPSSMSSPESSESTPGPSLCASSSGWPTDDAATNGTGPA